MKKLVYSFVLLLVAFCTSSCDKANSEPETQEQPYFFGWLGAGRKDDSIKYLKPAQEVKVNALTSRDEPAKLNDLIKEAGNIDIYYVIEPVAPEEEKEKCLQVMSAEEEQLALNPKDRLESRFQFGGEPVEGNIETLQGKRTPCFHRSEVVEETKQKIKEIIEACPGLAGIAFDKFGYHNYRACYCDESEKQLAKFHSENPSLSLEEAREKFSLETLVGFYNEMADYARELKPGFKTAAHVWPVFLPEPLYGNRLDIDYCSQTVAWFCKPYWSEIKIIRYTRETINKDKEYFQRQMGIPFVGIYWETNEALDKNAERFKHDLDVVLSATPHKRIAIATMKSVIDSPEHFRALKEVLLKHGMIPAEQGE